MTLPDPEIARRTCNLECTEKDPTGFTGLVKIILVDSPKNEYCKRIWFAGLIGIAYIMIGSATSIMFFFSLAMVLPFADNLHILLCTAGFQLFIPLGILMISELNGPSAPMRVLFRRCNHFFMQAFGLACGLAGAAAVVIFGKRDNIMDLVTGHVFAGVLTCLLGVCAAVFGPLLMFIKRDTCCFFHLIHVTFGTTTFAASSVCFVTGLMKPSVTQWLPNPEISYFLIAFCAGYTFIIFTVPIMRCSNKNNED